MSSDVHETIQLKYGLRAPHLLRLCAGVKKVIKGAWRMPWLTEATKDVISCDKPR